MKPLFAGRTPLLEALCLAFASASAAAADFSMGFLTLATDERFTPQALEKAYPDAPSGRSLAAAQLALEDASFALQGAGFAKGPVSSSGLVHLRATNICAKASACIAWLGSV